MSKPSIGDNRRRFLSELVSIDAWHEPIRIDDKSAGVFVELSFREGRIGGDDGELPFTFKASLRRAALVVRLEHPLKLDRSSVARSIPAKQAELTKVRSAREEVERKLGGNLGVDPAHFAAALNGELSKSTAISKAEELKVVQTIPEIMVTPFPEGVNAYSWSMEPTWKDFLKGQPWNPIDHARLRVGLDGKAQAIDPAITVELRCAFEDIEIYDLETKADSIFGLVKDTTFNLTNQKSAIQHLKRLIAEADLLPSKFDNRFNEVILANVIAMEG